MRKPLIIAMAAILAAVCLGGCSLLPTEEEILPPKLVSAAPVEYSTEEVTKGDLEVAITGDGYFRSFETVSAAFQTDGVLYSLNVKFNTKVKKGDTIAVLQDSSQLFLDLANKKKEVNNFLMEMENAEIEVNGGGQVALLKLELEQEKYDLSLMEKDGSSDSTALQAQRIRVEIAQTAYDNAVTKAQNTYDIATYNYEISYEEQQMLQKKYNACFLKAPISGICTWLSSTPVGGRVAAYEDFATIAPEDSIVMTYSSQEDASAYLNIGTELTVRYNGTDYVGKVIQTPQTQPPAATYGVKYMYFLELEGFDMKNASLLNTAGELKLVLDQRKDVIVIDTYLLTAEEDKYTVTVLENGLPIKKTVTIGIQNRTRTEILSGLNVGDMLIIG